MYTQQNGSKYNSSIRNHGNKCNPIQKEHANEFRKSMQTNTESYPSTTAFSRKAHTGEQEQIQHKHAKPRKQVQSHLQGQNEIMEQTGTPSRTGASTTQACKTMSASAIPFTRNMHTNKDSDPRIAAVDKGAYTAEHEQIQHEHTIPRK